MQREKPDHCEACNFETAELKLYDNKEPGFWLCEICAKSVSGNAKIYPNLYENKELLHMQAFCTNMVIAKMRKNTPLEARRVMFDSRSWFAKNSRCVCGYNIIVTQPSDGSGMDYWWYCSNKKCEHHSGEETGDMDCPDWVIDAPTENQGNGEHILQQTNGDAKPKS